MIGYIHLIIGPMFAGKTTEMIRIVNKYKYAKKRCLFIKHVIDDRYNKKYITTHNKITEIATTATKLMNLDVSNYDVIGIDEGQFVCYCFFFLSN